MTTDVPSPSDSRRSSVDEQIGQWRSFVRRRSAVHDADVDELEDHLRSQIEDLTDAGLSDDEAFLVAVKRMGSLDAVSHEFAQEHSDRLWKQLVLPGADPFGNDPAAGGRSDVTAMMTAAAVAGLAAVFLARTGESWTIRLLSFTVAPALAGYFAWKRQLSDRTVEFGLATFVVAALAMVFMPFDDPLDQTRDLAALHLPIALWFLVGVAYTSGRWRDSARRMDFVRFTGETAIYYALIGLGGGVLIGMTFAVFDSIGVGVDELIGTWVIPAGMAGAVVVAAWLVEAKQGVIEAMAPVLTRIFSPLFTLLFVAFLITIAVTGRGIDIDRDILILFDILLVVVLGLALYSISARDPEQPPGWFDRLQLAMIVSALAIDLLGLAFIVGRISEFGFSPNKTAALGENLILLVNLAGAAWLYLRFIRRQSRFEPIERWQTSYMIVYPIWAAIVVLAFPVIF